jgi:hypothetical protein
VLAHSFKAPFAKEFYCLLASLEAASLEYSKNITYVVTENASEYNQEDEKISQKDIY